MSYCNNFKILDGLIIYFTDNIFNNNIYGNRLNQVEIIIGIKIIDKTNKSVTISQYDLKNSIFLCDYTTGNEISNNSSNSTWNYSYSKSGYETAVRYFSSTRGILTPSDNDSTGYNYFKLYS
ncbi:hypothetical protein [Xenorhabdus bovienii]|uniref:hypothetical protein n=1 Tax=Xenorhabdus bovienii TaxID=40576 RepID=UPI0023B25668|nr:hypothetical protein [Xenorhabdus bovienii]MDE9441400.1 hypothetical protein [Xenorhabdus bovienii]MDE9457630.1 hypothetical protein [Xenorhabdus bovienii]MDE9514507.1 hypothetical protein [Xenorhabdus bovienii]